VPEEECKACDDEGHYIGSIWNPSKCETCTCESKDNLQLYASIDLFHIHLL
jgi:hypothetical protein